VVFISHAGNSADLGLIYPAILLTSAVGIMVGLGIYQKMSGVIEAQDKRQRPLACPRQRRDGVIDVSLIPFLAVWIRPVKA
jgi:hypothetical protein